MSRDAMPVDVDRIVKRKRPDEYRHNGPPPMTSEERARYDAEMNEPADEVPTLTAEDPFTARPGGAWIFDRPDKIPAIWGWGDEIAWPQGEALMLVGSDGTGKTVLALNLILRLIGISTETLLGLPVVERERVLYLAQDRPQQAARSFRRLVGTINRTVLDERLAVIDWPITSLEEDPGSLLALAQSNGADVIVLDSLKDVVTEPSSERSGQAAKANYQTAIAGGVETVLLHHDRKQAQDGKGRRLLKLSDVYGSRLMVAGCGSVLALNGASGDPTVELRQLKQVAGEVGPLRMGFDFTTGEVSIFEGGDLLSILKTAKEGLTAHDAARVLYETENVSNAERERARRKLKGLVARGVAKEIPAYGKEPAKYLTIDLTVPLTLDLTTERA